MVGFLAVTRLLLPALLAAATMAPAVALAQAVLIKGATVHTVGERGTLENADVRIEDGRIAEIGTGLDAPDGATVIEAKGRALTPGLFAGLTQIGLEEVNLEDSTYDAELEWTAPAWMHVWRPEFDVLPAFNPRSDVLAVTRVEGVTWAMLAPVADQSLIAGQGEAVALDGRPDAALDGSRSLFVNWGGDADDAAGGSRAAQYMLFDQAIREVRDPRAAGEGALLLPAGRDALKSYLGGGRVVFSAHRASDIRQVVRYAMEHGMKPVIAGGAEAWLVAEELAAADVPVILNPLDNLPDDFDRLASRFDNAKRLHEAGVVIAFSQVDETHQVRKNRQLAGNAAAHGLPRDVALAAITANPAAILGLGAGRGRIEQGQVADLVLWSGDPLEVTTVAENVWIAGRPVEMRSRQTELRDRYLERLKSRQAM
jgi:Amidohydrolase family